MKHKKNIFLNFCFSCLPGAGQMYHGLMKRGVSIMLLFFGMITFISYFQVDELLFVMPVIWFFSFFDSMQMNSMTEEEFAQIQDEFLFANADWKKLNFKKLRIPAAIFLIFYGFIALMNIFLPIIEETGHLLRVGSVFWSIEARLPRILFSVVIVWLGIHLIRGKKHEIEQEEE